MTKVSVVILNYDGKAYLEQFLPVAIDYSENAEVVVIDNASRDDSIDFLKSNYPDIRLIVLQENLGYAGGYNEGLKSISSEYCVLLNSDIEVSKNWLQPVIELMDNDPGIAACQPKILSYHQKEYFEYAGAAGGFIDWLGYPFCRGRIFDTTEKDTGQYDDIRQVFWASGACFFVRTSVFNQLGGFDQSFFAHMEEIDLCWRMNNEGFKVMVCPDSVIYHVGGGTLPVTNPRKTYLNFKNSLEMLTKNLGVSEVVLKIPLRCLLDWVAAVKFLLDGSANHSLAVLRAHWNYILILFRILKKRSKNGQDNSLLIYKRLLVMDYFLRKRKYFHQLKMR